VIKCIEALGERCQVLVEREVAWKLEEWLVQGKTLEDLQHLIASPGDVAERKQVGVHKLYAGATPDPRFEPVSDGRTGPASPNMYWHMYYFLAID